MGDRPVWICHGHESIREFNRTVPFMPCETRMAGGERYEVAHPDFISVSPRGSIFIVIDSHDRPHHLDALLIEGASQLTGHQRRKTRERSS